MSLLASWLASPPPDAAIEIAPESVSVAVVRGRAADATIESYAIEPLPPGAVAPSLLAPNVQDRGAVVAALRAALDRARARPRRVALVIPDLAARVSLVRFEQIPARREDLEQLIRWQVKKSVPFAVDEACLTYAPGSTAPDGGGEFVVALARRDVVLGYEEVCSAAGLYAGIVDVSTLSLINLLLAAGDIPSGDWLVTHVRPDYTSIAIMRGADMIFYRNRPEGDEISLADLVHQTVMYHQDRLAGQGFARVWLGAADRAPGSALLARQGLEERLGMPVGMIDPTRIAPLAGRGAAPAESVASLGPLVGMLLRSRTEAVTV